MNMLRELTHGTSLEDMREINYPRLSTSQAKTELFHATTTELDILPTDTNSRFQLAHIFNM